MGRQNVRVVVASEYPEVRRLISKIVERQGGTTVGQAQDAPQTMTLVRDVKPDIAIIDAYLPYGMSLHTLPLSRVGGLDIAQTITREAPNTEAVLLNNLDTDISDRVVSSENLKYSITTLEKNTPLVMRTLRQKTLPGNVVFANVEAQPEELPVQKAYTPVELTIFFGALGIAVGWFLIVAWISATVGGAIALAGMVAVFLGIAGKLTTSLWRRVLGRKP